MELQTKPNIPSIIKNGTLVGSLFLSSELLNSLHYFDTYPIIDIPFHFVGGFLIAQGVDLMTVNKLKIEWILTGVGVTGILWEISEVLRGITGSGMTLDTMKDLLMDMLGGATYILLSKKSLILSKI